MNENIPILLLSILSLVLYGFTLWRQRGILKRLDRHRSMIDASSKLAKLSYNSSMRVEALVSESQSTIDDDFEAEEGVDEGNVANEQEQDQPNDTVRPRLRRSYS